MPVSDFTQLTSVVIPVYNGERFIAEAIGSVQQQTWSRTEVIVVDDGSTDGTAALVRNITGVRYVFQLRAGPASALNHGAQLATGNYIAFLSADDLWLPSKLELQHAALATRSQRTLIFGRMCAFANDHQSRRRTERQAAGTRGVDALAAGTLLMTLSAFLQVGLFDERLQLGSFIDWYGRALATGMNVSVVPKVVALRRLHEGNFSTAMLKKATYLPALKMHLDRIRTSPAA